MGNCHTDQEVNNLIMMMMMMMVMTIMMGICHTD